MNPLDRTLQKYKSVRELRSDKTITYYCSGDQLEDTSRAPFEEYMIDEVVYVTDNNLISLGSVLFIDNGRKIRGSIPVCTVASVENFLRELQKIELGISTPDELLVHDDPMMRFFAQRLYKS